MSNWRKRARDIQVESNNMNSLLLFRSLRNDMTYLETCLADAALELDFYIQNEIDRLRGK